MSKQRASGWGQGYNITVNQWLSEKVHTDIIISNIYIFAGTSKINKSKQWEKGEISDEKGVYELENSTIVIMHEEVQ